MKIYIAGKITGLPFKRVRRKFERAERFLTRYGHEPVNPMKLPHNRYGCWEDFMATDIAHLMQCDAVFALPDWRESSGARLEVKLAHQLGKLIIFKYVKATRIPDEIN